MYATKGEAPSGEFRIIVILYEFFTSRLYRWIIGRVSSN